MKKNTKLAGLAVCLFAPLLTSCYVPPGGYYPPNPGGGPPNPGGIIVPQPKQKVLASYSISSIQTYKLPNRRSGTVSWDARNPLISPRAHYPDVYSVIKSGGSRVGTSLTRQDHNPAAPTLLVVNSRNLNYDTNRRIHVSFYDRDKKNDDLMAGYNVTIRKPASGVRSGSQIVKYRNSNGDVYFKINLRYNWVLR